MSAIATQGLGKRYGSKWALRDCTIEVPEGSVTALVGPNGAGKTTLLQLAVGLTRPSAGDVTVLGLSPRDPRPGAAGARRVRRPGASPAPRVHRRRDAEARAQAQPRLGRRARSRARAAPRPAARPRRRPALGRSARAGR